ncbi:engulfment and cell motility 3 isoform X1 [Pelobates cultripes]|uniref:Engulfment and cell motility 3 isoform X1 n=1 Tax=Pelobates cultripes TaxID=61616 RepID=A0AAD1THZ0_PELCU|nr:engulfment and cell motility 3 isoform X1 [Pelobates cultripes]
MEPSKNIVKIAIQMMGAYPQLIELNQVLSFYCNTQQPHSLSIAKHSNRILGLLRHTATAFSVYCDTQQPHSLSIATHSNRILGLLRHTATAFSVYCDTQQPHSLSIATHSNRILCLLRHTATAFSSKPLSAVLKDVCDTWNIGNPEQYTLQYVDGHQEYITELNRMDIKNGSILRLTTSPPLEALASCRAAGKRARGSQTLSHTMISIRGDLVVSGGCVSWEGGTVPQALTYAVHLTQRDHLEVISDTVEVAVVHRGVFLVEDSHVSYDQINQHFIQKIVAFVNMNQMVAQTTQLSLAVLENMVQSSSNLGDMVRHGVTLDRLLGLLQVSNQEMQIKAMALIVALLQRVGEKERQEMLDYLWKKNMRQFIHKHIIHGWAALGDEMSHYLYVLQCLSLGLLETRMKSAMDPNDPIQRQHLQSLRLAAFPSEGEDGAHLTSDRRRSLCAKEFRKLGYSNNGSPWQDLCLTPPGLLALDNMVYFSTRWPSAYSRFVLENISREDQHACPFARSSIYLSLILCDILRVGEPGTFVYWQY